MDTLIELFKSIIIMSAMTSIVILIVLSLRILLQKSSRKLIYGLWIIVAIRLIIPVMLPSNFSLFNLFDKGDFSDVHVISSDGKELDSSNITNTNLSLENNAIITTSTDEAINNNTITSRTFTVSLYGHLLNLPEWSVFIWFGGIGVFLVFFIASYIYLSRKLRFATLTLDTNNNNKTYFCENISAPFVFGVIKPRIYVPYGIKDIHLDLILQHEQYHIKKKDYLTKLLAYVLLSVYWFCPFVWVAYYMFQKDMELRCDEAILKNADIETRKCYSNTLLAFAGNNRKYLLSPVAFSENSVKERIKFSLKSHKKSIFATIIILFVIIIIGAICLTDSKEEKEESSPNTSETSGDIINSVETETEPETIYYGNYTVRVTGEYGTFDADYIYISEDEIEIGFSGTSSAPEWYTYTIDNNTILASNDESEIKITIVNSMHLMYKDMVYIYRDDVSNNLELDSYIDVITNNDIEAAINVAKDYYSTTTIEINDLLFIDDESLFSQLVDDKYLELYEPGNIICLETTAIWGGSNVYSPRYIALCRKDAYSEWTVFNEGK